MTQTTLHFVFSPSGGANLVEALEQAGRDDQVVTFFDDLSFGPIDPPDSVSRAKWVEDELGRTGWDEMTTESERGWQEALSPDRRKVAWLTRRSAMEYAGFLEWLWRIGDAPCEVVDLSEVEIACRPEHRPRPPRLAMCLGMLHHDTIRDHKFWELAEPLQTTERHRYRDLWQQLRSENAPLRISDGEKLVSAPMSFFDSVLMSYVTDKWQQVSRVVGPAMASQMDDWVIQTGDMFLAVRVNALAKNGRLEIRGKSALEILFSEVRLPRSRG
ncbi:MAG: hypothetical protein QOJ15_5450 [Bradyrhizobium sp.]|jgi:hypothetical protein|nr:hypothetical protein [Bradyrhizobium sp.]